MWWRLFVAAVVLVPCLGPMTAGKAQDWQYAERAFEGIGEDDLLWLHVSVALLDDVGIARIAMRQWTSDEELERAIAMFAEQVEAPASLEVDAAEAPDLGDESFLLAGAIDSPVMSLQLAMLMIRSGKVVYTLSGVGFDDPSPDLISVFEAIDQRQSDEVEDLLPDADDLPYPMTELDTVIETPVAGAPL